MAWDAWRVNRGGPGALAARQRVRLGALVEHARDRSPFYAELYRGLPQAPALDQLPVTSKPELMARFDDWVTDPAVTRAGVEDFVADPGNLGRDYLGRYVVFTTSGSTGTPALLVQDHQALAVMTGLALARSAAIFAPAVLARVLLHGGRSAAILATGGHFLGATMFERRRRSVRIRRRITRLISVLDPVPRLVQQLNDFRPAIVGSYASVLEVLAQEQESGRLRISPVVITSAGELLLPPARQRIEAAFGCPVVEAYAASEAAPLSTPCRGRRLHINADWFLVEPIDADGRPVPPGRRSDSVLVTNLANHVQPVIRYQLGDSVVVSPQPCPCGSQLPTIEVEGRTDETLHLPGITSDRVDLLPMAVATVVEETPGVRRFQVIQTAPATLAVRLEPAPGADVHEVWTRVQGRLTDYLHEQKTAPVQIEVDTEPPRPDPRSGKLRHVLRGPGADAPAPRPPTEAAGDDQDRPQP